MSVPCPVLVATCVVACKGSCWMKTKRLYSEGVLGIGWFY